MVGAIGRGHTRALQAFGVGATFLVGAGAVLAAVGQPGAETIRVSVDSAGGQADDASLDPPSLSRNGRRVAFTSLASNLVAGDTAGQFDVFVHDIATGTTTRVSVDPAGHDGVSWSGHPAISADGRWVSFASLARNLVPGDTNVCDDVFVRDLRSGETRRVSVSSAGDQGNADSIDSAISADGRWVAFDSFADNLVPGDDNGEFDVFLHDMRDGTTTRVSVASPGEGGSGGSYPSISANGRWVAFQSFSSNLVPGDSNGFDDVFVHDGLTGETTLVSVDSAGIQGNSTSGDPAISADGRWVAFTSYSDNLVPGDTGASDVFVHDRRSGATTRVSVTASGGQADGNSYDSTISSDGRFVAFQSYATNLVPGDTNGDYDIFVHDRRTGSITRASVGPAGLQADGLSASPALCATGRRIAFTSEASNLVPHDTNRQSDVFVHDLR